MLEVCHDVQPKPNLNPFVSCTILLCYFGTGVQVHIKASDVCHHTYSTPALKPGRVIRVTFSPGHPGLTRFTIYPGLTRIGSREKRNCSFDDAETYKRYRIALS